MGMALANVHEDRPTPVWASDDRAEGPASTSKFKRRAKSARSWKRERLVTRFLLIQGVGEYN
jgi:hypothetical protein